MAKKKLLEYLRKNNRKYSIERDDMLGVIASMDGCYSISELFRKAEEQRAIHAKSTIYRNIDLFMEAGLIERAEQTGKRPRYRTNPEIF